PQGERHDHRASEALGTGERAQGEADVPDESLDGLEPARSPDASHGVARQEDVAEFLESGQPCRFRILAAVDALLDAQREVAPDLLVELVHVRVHGCYSLPGAGFMTSPIAWMSCDHRSCSRRSWALPVGVSR